MVVFPAFLSSVPVRAASSATVPRVPPVCCAAATPEGRERRDRDDRVYRTKVRRRLAARMDRLRRAAGAANHGSTAGLDADAAAAAAADPAASSEAATAAASAAAALRRLAATSPDQATGRLADVLGSGEEHEVGDGVEGDQDIDADLLDDDDLIILDDADRPVVESIGGAWLDAAVAGRRAGTKKAQDAAAAAPETQAAMHRFVAGVQLFQTGRYRDARKAFEDAVRLVGEASRLGGEVGLWRAQAIYAMGGADARKDACTMLDALEKHADGQVRKAARELKFILTAPVLPLDPGSFVEIPDFDAPQDEGPRFILAASGVGRMVPRRLTKPEKYSLEWYLEKDRPLVANAADHSTDWLPVAVFVLAAGTFLASSLVG